MRFNLARAKFRKPTICIHSCQSAEEPGCAGSCLASKPGYILDSAEGQGEPYDETRLGYDLRALYKSNFFENIEIQSEDGDTGKILIFIVKEKLLIRAIEYSGNKSFTLSDIFDAFKDKKVGLTVDSQYDSSKISAAERVLKELMIQHGKPLGTVHTEIESAPPGTVRIHFVLNEDGDEHR